MLEQFDIGCLRACPTASNINPLGEARAFLALDFDNIGIAAASASNTVLLLFVPLLPVRVLFLSLAFIQSCHLKILGARQLASRGVGRTVLNGSVPVTKIAEVVDISGR